MNENNRQEARTCDNERGNFGSKHAQKILTNAQINFARNDSEYWGGGRWEVTEVLTASHALVVKVE